MQSPVTMRPTTVALTPWLLLAGCAPPTDNGGAIVSSSSTDPPTPSSSATEGEASTSGAVPSPGSSTSTEGTTRSDPDPDSGTTMSVGDDGPPIMFDLGAPGAPSEASCTILEGACEPDEMCHVTVPGVPEGNTVIGCEDLPRPCVADPSCACVEPILGGIPGDDTDAITCYEDMPTPITVIFVHW